MPVRTDYPTFVNAAVNTTIERTDWQENRAYRFHVLLIKDDDADSYSSIVLNLPGIGSCGDTEEEALNNVREALRGALDAYKESGLKIPWKDTSAAEIPAGAKMKLIALNA